MDHEIFKISGEILLLCFGLYMTWKNKNKASQVRELEKEVALLRVETIVKEEKIEELSEEVEDLQLLIDHMDKRTQKQAARKLKTQEKIAEASAKNNSTRVYIKELFNRSQPVAEAIVESINKGDSNA